mgnify:CR=1 FL=1
MTAAPHQTALLEYLPMPALIHRGGMIDYANPAFRRFLPADLRDDPITDLTTLFIPESQSVLTNYFAAFTSSDTSGFMGQFTFANGDVRYLMLHGQTLPTATTPKTAFTTITDITKTAIFGQPLQDAETRYRHLTHLATQAAYHLRIGPDGLGTTVWASGPLEQLAGISWETYLQSDDWQHLVPPEDRPALAATLTAMPNGKATSLEFRIHHPTRGLRWLRLSFQPYRDLNTPNTVDIFVAISDVTDRHQIETDLRNSQAYLDALLNALPDLFFIHDRENCYLRVHIPAHHRHPLAPPQDIVGKTFAEVLPRDIAELAEQAHNLARTTAEPQTIEYSLKLADGLHHFESRIIPMPGVDQTISLVRDVTDQREDEMNLRRTNDQLVLFSHVSSQLQTATTRQDVFQLLNVVGALLFPGSNGVVFLKQDTLPELQKVVQWGDNPDLAPPTLASRDCVALTLGHTIIHHRHERATCQHLNMREVAGQPVQSICLPIWKAQEISGVIHIYWPPTADLTDHLQLANLFAERLSVTLHNLDLTAELEYRSTHDILTDLYNRRFLESTLEYLLKDASETHPVSVLMFDIDHFKHFNDTWGHVAGDHVLAELGQGIRHSIRVGDVACRYGGEEFCVILPGASVATATLRGQAMLERIHAMPLNFEGRDLGHITISMGVASAPTHGVTVDTLLQFADAALYTAKQSGRDRLVVAPIVHGSQTLAAD